MITLMMERRLPASFDPADADLIARHCRIAVDAHRAAGTHWLGSYIADDRIFGLVAVEREADLAAYWRAAASPTRKSLCIGSCVGSVHPTPRRRHDAVIPSPFVDTPRAALRKDVAESFWGGTA